MPHALNLPFDPLGLKLVIFVQLVLAFFSNIAGFFSYNMVTFTICLWAVYKADEYEPMFIGLCFIFFSILLDIIVLSLYGGDMTDKRATATTHFCVSMCIIGVILKPWPIYVCYREFEMRGGDLHTYFTFLNKRDSYEPVVDQPPNYSGFTGSTAPVSTSDKQPLNPTTTQAAPANSDSYQSGGGSSSLAPSDKRVDGSEVPF
eukprot:m.820721 g.820721  ORF g.820721 m.820721 type:complete len:203 (+) comp23397_c2_seq1:94-702(+)